MPNNEIYSDLMYIAEDELESAKILANHHRPKIEISTNLCQLCAEKSLKAFLAFHNVKFKYIHNLLIINNDCQKIDSSFKTILNECRYLNKFVSNNRYEKHLTISESDMQIAIKFAEKILNFVKNKTKEM